MLQRFPTLEDAIEYCRASQAGYTRVMKVEQARGNARNARYCEIAVGFFRRAESRLSKEWLDSH